MLAQLHSPTSPVKLAAWFNHIRFVSLPIPYFRELRCGVWLVHCVRVHDTHSYYRSGNHREKTEDQARVDAAGWHVVGLDGQHLCGGYNCQVEAGWPGRAEEEGEGGEEALMRRVCCIATVFAGSTVDT